MKLMEDGKAEWERLLYDSNRILIINVCGKDDDEIIYEVQLFGLFVKYNLHFHAPSII